MSEYDELQQALKNKKKPIPLIDIRYVIREFIDCVKGHKKYKDLQKLKDFLLTYPNLDKKFINKQKTKQKIHDYIDKYNEKKCPKGFAKMKRQELEEYAIKNNIDIGESIRGKAPRKTSGNVFKPLEGLTGIKKYANKTEQEQIVTSYENIDPFKVNIKSVNKYGSLTGESTLLKLRNNQTIFIEKMIYSNNRGAIAYWGVGTGKTILTTLTIRNYLHYNPKGKVVFIAPSGLLSNLVETLFRFGLDIRDNRIKYYSFEKYTRTKYKDCENALLVIDEAHNLRTQIIMKESDPSKAKKGGRAYSIIKNCSPHASKVLLLTATPILNTSYDIENLLAMIDGRGQTDRPNFNETISDEKIAEDYFKLRISYFKRTFDDKDFPAKKNNILTFTMTKEETHEYRKIQELKMGFGTSDKLKIDDEEYSSSFFSGQRQFINVVGNNKKMRGVINHLKKNKYEHTIIYMSFVVKGIRIMKQLLEKANYKVSIVSGDEGAVEKQQSVEAYNTGKIDVIIISKAGAEGLDLKNTSALYLLDQPWNEATREQIIGRGVRFKSHESLPPKERVVNVFNVFLLAYNSDVNKGNLDKADYENVVGAEEKYVKNVIDKITNDKEYSLISNLMKFNKALLKNELRKEAGLEEAKIDLSKISATIIDKNKSKKMGMKVKDYTDSVSKAINEERMKELNPPSSPSIDLYLYLFSKSKQYVINVFVKWLNTLPSFEDGITQAEKDIMDKLKVLSNPTDEDKLDIYREVLKTYINNAGKLITKKNIDTLTSLKVQQKQGNFNLEQKNKWVNKLKQEFFTPDSEIRIMYGLSKIEEDKREELKFGDLTAGNGAVIQYFFKRHPNLEIRACELEEENRTHLKNYFKTAGLSPTECLYNEGNLLKLRISDAFDYMVINPPFNLSPQGIYTKKIYDIDFIRKAYVNLKVGGKMVYIMYGNHYLKNLKGRLGEIWEWLDKHTEKHYKRTIKWEGDDNKVGKLPIVYGLIIKKDNLEDNDLLEYTDDLLIDKVTNPIIPPNISMDIEESKTDEKELHEEDIFKTYMDMKESFINKKIKYPIFICTNWIARYMYNYILDINSSDCIYDLPDFYNEKEGGNAELILGRKYNYQEYVKTYSNYYTNNKMSMDDEEDLLDKQLRKYGLGNINMYKKSLTKEYNWGGYDPVFLRNNGFDRVYTKYEECKKNKLILCIQLSIGDAGGHANMLIINYHTNTFERYEPHGDRTGGRELNMNNYLDSEEYDKMLIKMMDYINKTYKQSFKYVPPNKTCPKPPKGETQIVDKKGFVLDKRQLKKKYPNIVFKKGKNNGKMLEQGVIDNEAQFYRWQGKGKFRLFTNHTLPDTTEEIEKDVGFQTLEADEEDTSELQEDLELYNNILYKETGGYCCMWSYFMMDLRLKNPKGDPQKLLSNAYKNLNKGDKPFRTFIRAFTQTIMDDMEKNFKGLRESYLKSHPLLGVGTKNNDGSITKFKDYNNRETMKIKKAVYKFLDEKLQNANKNLKSKIKII